MNHPAIQIVARLAGIEPGAVSQDATLGSLGLKSSLGLGILRSALERRYQRRLGPFTWESTVSSVLAALEGAGEGASSQPAPRSQPGPASSNRGRSGPFAGRTRYPVQVPGAVIGHGVDIQETAAMPGYPGSGSVDPFYTDHFSSAELAAAASRPDPKESLCGVWSAKEAIRKSHPELAALSYREIEIAWGSDGRPIARLARPPSRALEVNLSISHSGAYAVASAVVCAR